MLYAHSYVSAIEVEIVWSVAILRVFLSHFALRDRFALHDRKYYCPPSIYKNIMEIKNIKDISCDPVVPTRQTRRES